MNRGGGGSNVMKQDRELQILNKISEALNRSVDLAQSLQTVLALVADLLGLKTSWIFLFDEKTEQPYLAGARNLPPALANDPRLMHGWCYCLETYNAGDLDGAANVNVITCSRLKKRSTAPTACVSTRASPCMHRRRSSVS